ncbi:hypothetical protein [Chryseobacterium sp. OV279]|uniref:hypothetical protein n=1 Tax=Chryseobacterium sp. OV279 TaxID=1500285 RepID=UPI0009166601|nr:hypothetical protein [Chryseobacterium sp. OV279]SHE95571.1 hypothetical protein SAMN02787100_1218 [Chryseobacterium sp. OV279]
MELKHKLTTTPELFEIYKSLYIKISTSFYSINRYQYNDCRTHFYKRLISDIETTMLLVELLATHYPYIPSIEKIDFKSNEEMAYFLNSKLSNVTNNIRESLFQRIFLRFEGFIRTIAKYQNLEDHKLLTTIQKLIENLHINTKFLDFSKLLLYTRNTIHFEGFQTNSSASIYYNGIEYQFIKDKPLAFYNIEFLSFLITEIDCFILAIINSDCINKVDFIEHISTGITHNFID